MTDANQSKLKAMRKREQTAKQEWEQPALASPSYVARKLAACVRLARQCSRDSWQCPTHRAEFLRIKREAMQDARAWTCIPTAERLYNVIWIRDDNGARGQLNATPMTHREACTFKSKIAVYHWRRVVLEEVAP